MSLYPDNYSGSGNDGDYDFGKVYDTELRSIDSINLRSQIDLTGDWTIYIEDEYGLGDERLEYPIVFADGQVVPENGWRIYKMIIDDRTKKVLGNVFYAPNQFGGYSGKMNLIGNWNLQYKYESVPKSNEDGIVVKSTKRDIRICDDNGYIYPYLLNGMTLRPCMNGVECTIKGRLTENTGGEAVDFNTEDTLEVNGLESSKSVTVGQKKVILKRCRFTYGAKFMAPRSTVVVMGKLTFE